MIRKTSVYLTLVAVLLFAIAATAPQAWAENAKVNCRIESPVDGSFWIGTAGDGLFRLGRNGRSVRYSQEEGQLRSDIVVSLIFDNNNVLWILDGSGVFSTYSSIRGFQEKSDLPEGILAASHGKSPELILFATKDKIYSLNTVDNRVDVLSALSVIPQSIHVSNSSDEIWIFAENAVQKMAMDGSLLSWEGAPSVSDSLPFIFETIIASSAPRSRFSSALLLYFLFVVLGILAVIIIRRYVLNSYEETMHEDPKEVKNNIPLSSVGNALSEINNRDTTLNHLRDTANLPATSSDTLGDTTISSSNHSKTFTKIVLSMIKENISNPDFDVEAIAQLAGISRIHVNRKLKAEGSGSPSSLIKEARMSLATKLLKQGKLTISQISVESGFRTPSYFATVFKDYYGVSPTEFLEGNRG